jgi:hypothetical protein
VWDRRHAVDAALFLRTWRSITLSAQATYGSGMPFWPWAGNLTTPRLNPLMGQTWETGYAPVFADRQIRYPDYFRVDVGARVPLRLWRVRMEPSIGLRNVTERGNVFYYRTETRSSVGDPGTSLLVPVQPFPSSLVVSLGLDVRL